MNENSNLAWTIFRDGKEHHRAINHKQAQQIIRHARRIFPASQFKVVYNGKNLGARRSEEFCG
jgi:hypothetical protein